jgi:hypothetical protein
MAKSSAPRRHCDFGRSTGSKVRFARHTTAIAKWMIIASLKSPNCIFPLLNLIGRYL